MVSSRCCYWNRCFPLKDRLISLKILEYFEYSYLGLCGVSRGWDSEANMLLHPASMTHVKWWRALFEYHLVWFCCFHGFQSCLSFSNWGTPEYWRKYAFGQIWEASQSSKDFLSNISCLATFDWGTPNWCWRIKQRYWRNTISQRCEHDHSTCEGASPRAQGWRLAGQA